jgi:hypothetical protein
MEAEYANSRRSFNACTNPAKLFSWIFRVRKEFIECKKTAVPFFWLCLRSNPSLLLTMNPVGKKFFQPFWKIII